MASNNREKSRQEFMAKQEQYRGPNRVVYLVALLVAVTGVGWFWFANKDTAAVPRRWQGGSYNIGQTVSYKGQVVSMSDIPSEVDEGEIRLDLAEIVAKRIIYTEYEGGELPLTAFISPAGRLIVAVAMCEPCRSTRFRIEENHLVCETCGTRWNLYDLQGISGGCPQYPPEEVPYQVVDGTVVVDPDLLQEWTPRI